tara:strand:+ start:858 stop:968 length:111 start_codon:yes stop_codon:yes gene_type:complete
MKLLSRLWAFITESNGMTWEQYHENKNKVKRKKNDR